MTNLKDKPFALIGVNVERPRRQETQGGDGQGETDLAVVRGPGRTGQGAIAARWNVPATPTLYVIDHKGVIRHKWVGSPGEKAIDAALEKLIKEAEGTVGINRREVAGVEVNSSLGFNRM